jgi:predicted transcriptional regulator of viral defense system
MHIQELRAFAQDEVIDYVFLTHALKQYAQPRNKIRNWLKTQALIRVKKGLYIFGPHVARQPYHKEKLANLIYGPSAISLEYALNYHGLIPERVETLTSITPRRNKTFTTPIGQFTYRYLAPDKYALGIDLEEIDPNHQILMASPEKALCDLLFFMEDSLENYATLETHLYANLRLEHYMIPTFNHNLVNELAKHYKNPNVNLLSQYITGKYHA